MNGIMNRAKKGLYHFNKNKELLFLTLPGLLLIIIFNYIPMFGLQVAFKNYTYDKGIWGSEWIGFKNFEFFFTSQDAFRVTRNTILYNMAFIITGTVAALVVALVLCELSKKSVKIFQTAFLTPYFLSWVVVSFVLYAFLSTDHGVLNQLITSFGGKAITWYNEPGAWPPILVICSLWKSVGYTSIIYYTGLMGIDPTYYEAAQIDGASRLQRIRYISIPGLRTLITLLIILAIGRIFYSDFGMFYFLPRDSGILYKSIDIIDLFVYRALRKTGDVGMASAAGAYQSLVGFVLVLITNRIVKKIDESSSLF